MTARLNLILTCLGATMFCAAQNPVQFDRLSTKDGLSQSDVNCIYQDQKGYMWFGTHDGLNKYDGYEFTVFKPTPDAENTINSNLIFDIIGDNNNRLWIGTTGHGLNYFDTATGQFQAFLHDESDPHSLGSDHVTRLFLDDSNRLWVGSRDGLDMLELNKSLDTPIFHHFGINSDYSENSEEEVIVYSILQSKNKDIYVASHRGLFKLGTDKTGRMYFNSLSKAIDLGPVGITALAEDDAGNIYVGSADGLYLLSVDSPDKIKRIRDGYFHELILDDNSTLWAGSNSGLYLFRVEKNQEIPTLVEHLAYDPMDEKSLSKNVVKSLFQDRTGITWVGTNGGGINKYDPGLKKFQLIKKTSDPNSLSYDKIRAMFEDSNGDLWIGTEGGGLNKLAKEDDNRHPEYFESFNNVTKPFALEEINRNGKKILLVGGEDSYGICQIDITNPDQSREIGCLGNGEITNGVFAIKEDSKGILWIGTYSGGVHRWVSTSSGGYKKDLFLNDVNDQNSLPSDIVRNIFEDSKGTLWFATGNGLARLSNEESSKEKPKFQVYKKNAEVQGSISHNYILTLYESRSGDFWAGTFGGGLNKLIPGKTPESNKFIAYTEEDGLPNNVVKGILEDSYGNLWLSTNKGLSKFNPISETFKNYDANDGLQDNEFQELACLKRANGEMLFGGINGYNAFNPNDIVDNLNSADAVITKFMISNQNVEVGQEVNGRIVLEESVEASDELQLKFRENSFSFQFAALHYAVPEKNQFAYMLEGFDEDWVHTGPNNRFATYTNLEPGTYMFKVKASNNDGFWNKEPTVLEISIAPPWYRTNIAFVLYGLLAIAFVWLFWRYTFIRTSKKHELELEHLEKEQAEEMQKLKLEFFTNISHEFRTPLTLLQGPLEHLQKKGETLERNVVREQLKLMSKNVDYLLRLVNQLLDFRKINQGKMHLVVRHSDIASFIREVAEPFQFQAHNQSIDFQVKSSTDTVLSWFDHDALEKIVNNLFSNAFKFTPEGGSITASISTDQKTENGLEAISIKVQDTGPGIDQDKLNQVFQRFYMEKPKNKKNSRGAGIGLSFVKSLIELHRGTIKVTSQAGEGTCFQILLPSRRAEYENREEITIKTEMDNDFLVRSSESDSIAIGINDDIVDEHLSKSRSKKPILLVVDDNTDIQSFISQVLADSYTIHCANNGKEALEVVQQEMPNIVLCDVLMPEMNGIEFSKVMKGRQETSHIPIILLTAKASEESELEGLKTGVDDYVRKPFNLELLKLKLTNITQRREQLRKRFNREIKLVPSEVTTTSSDEQFLTKAMEIVEKHMTNTDFNVHMMVKEMGFSRSNLYLKFKELTGLSSSEFIRNIRLKRAVQLLEDSDFSVKEIMYQTGFNTASYFSKCFKKQFGVIPSEYVKSTKSKKEPTPL